MYSSKFFLVNTLQSANRGKFVGLSQTGYINGKYLHENGILLNVQMLLYYVSNILRPSLTTIFQQVLNSEALKVFNSC